MNVKAVLNLAKTHYCFEFHKYIHLHAFEMIDVPTPSLAQNVVRRKNKAELLMTQS